MIVRCITGCERHRSVRSDSRGGIQSVAKAHRRRAIDFRCARSITDINGDGMRALSEPGDRHRPQGRARQGPIAARGDTGHRTRRSAARTSSGVDPRFCTTYCRRRRHLTASTATSAGEGHDGSRTSELRAAHSDRLLPPREEQRADRLGPRRPRRQDRQQPPACGAAGGDGGDAVPCPVRGLRGGRGVRRSEIGRSRRDGASECSATSRR